MRPEEAYIQLAQVRLHTLTWQPEIDRVEGPPFLLLHGLSSNARTWELVAQILVKAGYLVVAVDQRGHGLSEKPDHGYDFVSITSDLYQLIEQLELEHPILAGQSWGGNVVLEAAAQYPGLASGLVFVDGGFLELKSRGTWEQIAVELKPPDLAGMPRDEIARLIGEMHPTWIPAGVEATLGNFEQLDDGTVRPWLALENHLAILKALYDQDVSSLFPQIQQPVLICAADDRPERIKGKKYLVETAAQQIPHATVRWFYETAHDIHVDRPVELAEAIIEFAAGL